MVMFDFHMALQITESGTTVITVLTFIRFLSCVLSNVVAHVSSIQSMVITKNTYVFVFYIRSDNTFTNFAVI